MAINGVLCKFNFLCFEFKHKYKYTVFNSTHGVNPSLLLLSNMVSMMTVKLDYNNYLVWRHQIEVILEAYSMINFIEDNLEAPDPLLKDSSGNYTTEANLEYIQWRNREQTLFTFINSTLSPSILALTVVAVCFDEEELIHLALEALPPKYDAFCYAIRTRSDVVTLEELNTLLNAEERSIKKRRRGKNSDNRGRGNGRGNSNGQFSVGQPNQFTTGQSQFFGQSYNGQEGQRPVCQNCGKNGHTALDCYHRMNFAYQGRRPPAKLASMAASSMDAHSGPPSNQNWLTDI
ncbi:hypothetical protein SO802_008727, partial [Lithocarpus litseifolius]